MARQEILAGQTGLQVRTILNENFEELYDKAINTFYGWGYQDFNTGVINATNVTITANQNGTGFTFDPAKMSIPNSAAIVRVSDNNLIPYSTLIPTFLTKIKCISQTEAAITLSAVPHTTYGALRIYYRYTYDIIPIGYTQAPDFLSSQKLDALDGSFATDDDMTIQLAGKADVNHTHNEYITEETDPVFTSSEAYNITSENTGNWNDAFSWGDHAGLYDTVGTASSILAGHNITYDHSKLHSPGSDAETTTSIGALIAGATEKTTPVDADMVGLMDSQATNTLKKLSWLNIKEKIRTFLLDSFKTYHGVVRGSIAQLPTHITTTTFTINFTSYPCTYYYQGTKVVVSLDKNATLDDGADGTTAGLYYVYFNGATGNLLCTKAFPGLTITSNVIFATVVWNGVDYGLVGDERHSYNRDLNWHYWAHTTVGTRYLSGIDFIPTGTGATATFTSTSGTLADEDIQFSFPDSSDFPTANTIRTWYQTGASTYTFDNVTSLIPYRAGTGSRPQYVNSTGYVLTTMTSAVNRYINTWIYGTQDLHTPLYSFVETVSSAVAGTNGYSSVANARAIPFPNLSGFGLSPELKPLYRMVVRADGQIQALTAADDYRLVSSLPMSAGSTSTTAGAVTFSPYGNISSTTVQTAIQELDDEKLSDIVNDLSPQLGGNLELNGKCVDMTATLGTDLSYSGRIETVTVGENVVFGDILYLKFSDLKWWKAKADAFATMPGQRMALASISANNSGVVLIDGFVRNDAWTFTASTIYVSTATAGAMVSTAPNTTGNQIQTVGTAFAVSKLKFRPSIDVGEK